MFGSRIIKVTTVGDHFLAGGQFFKPLQYGLRLRVTITLSYINRTVTGNYLQGKLVYFAGKVS